VTRQTIMPDGSDPAAYRWLRGLDRSGWAWEWLRRDPHYAAPARPDEAAHASGPILLKEAPDSARGLLFPRESPHAGMGSAALLRFRDRSFGAGM